MNDLFVQFGVQAGGGPAFLKRTRSAVGQLQTRTAVGATGNQRQQRHRTCNCSTSFMIVRSGGTCDWRTETRCDNFGYISNGPNCNRDAIRCDSYCSSTSNAGQCIYHGYHDDGSQMMGHLCCAVPATVISSSSCNWSGWSGYYNVDSCSPSYPGCSSGAQQRECQTISVCNFGAFSSWTNVQSCTPANPSCSNGAIQRECQTIDVWSEWTEWEEAETCTPQSPELTSGAIQIECQAI